MCRGYHQRRETCAHRCSAAPAAQTVARSTRIGCWVEGNDGKHRVVQALASGGGFSAAGESSLQQRLLYASTVCHMHTNTCAVHHQPLNMVHGRPRISLTWLWLSDLLLHITAYTVCVRTRTTPRTTIKSCVGAAPCSNIVLPLHNRAHHTVTSPNMNLRFVCCAGFDAACACL